MTFYETLRPRHFKTHAVPAMAMGWRVLLGFVLLPAAALCQAQPQLVPRGPLIARVPQFADWTVTYKYPGDDSKDRPSQQAPKSDTSLPGAKLRQERAIKTRNILHLAWTDEDGAKEECWLIDGIQWATPKGSQLRIPAVNAESPFYRENLPLRVFPGFEWIDASRYIGIQPFMGTECLVFRNSEQPQNQQTAYIDAETRLPVCLQSRDSVCLYAFRTPPAEMLQVPGDIARVIAEENARTAKAMAPGAR